VAALKLEDGYTLFTTDRLRESRDFYVRWFGFRPAFEASWFVWLVSEGERPMGLAFMQSGHETQHPEDRVPCRPEGLFITFQVADAAAAHRRLRDAGLPMHRELCDEPWGQRHFMVLDPNGIKVDVVEQTEPQPGFWDRYLPAPPA
jgi:catechol 2,3-dioxygenase-like lactoylglutathione lyase family enzyme